jgi:hypothetical protein
MTCVSLPAVVSRQRQQQRPQLLRLPQRHPRQRRQQHLRRRRRHARGDVHPHRGLGRHQRLAENCSRNKICNFGGNPGPQSTVTIYDIATNNWTIGAAMPVSITYGRGAAAGNQAYYVSGIARATVSTV